MYTDESLTVKVIAEWPQTSFVEDPGCLGWENFIYQRYGLEVHLDYRQRWWNSDPNVRGDAHSYWVNIHWLYYSKIREGKVHWYENAHSC